MRKSELRKTNLDNREVHISQIHDVKAVYEGGNTIIFFSAFGKDLHMHIMGTVSFKDFNLFNSYMYICHIAGCDAVRPIEALVAIRESESKPASQGQEELLAKLRRKHLGGPRTVRTGRRR